MNNNFNNHFNTLNSHIKSLKDNNIKNKDISFKKSKNKISQIKISSNNKTILLDKKDGKPPFRQKKINLEVIDKILINRRKNNLSRNIISLFNNISQNKTNKNFNSLKNALNGAKNNKINDERTKLSFSSNLTQQLKSYKSNKLKVKDDIPSQIRISTDSLKNYLKPKAQKKKNVELNVNKNKIIEINKKKINMIDVKDKLKNNIYMKNENKNVTGLKVQKDAKRIMQKLEKKICNP